MRVLHVIPVLDPATGGPPAVVASLCAVLPPLGIQPSIASYNGWPHDGSPRRVATLLESLPDPNAIPLHSLGTLSQREIFSSANAKRSLSQIIPQYDLVHLHGVWDPVILSAARLARQLQRPYIISTHGMLEPWAVRSKLKKKLLLLLGWQSMLQHAAALHDYRPGPIRLLGRTLSPPVYEIANGIFPAQSPTRDQTSLAWDALCSRFPLLRESWIVLFMGRLAQQKGPDILLETVDPVVKSVPGAVFVFAGADYGLENHLAARKIKLRHGDSALLTGPLFGAEKDALLAHASLFVAPSRHEGFSLSVLEAMRAGLPTILSQACHFQHAADANAARVINLDGNLAIETLTHQIISLLKDETTARQIGLRAQQLVNSHYTWPTLAHKYHHMYTQALLTPTSNITPRGPIHG